MIKLNRKGFTLIELLAVVILLGIILVVTIPSVISSTNVAKEKQLKNAANTVADWYTKQYQLYVIDKTLADEAFYNPDPENPDVNNGFMPFLGSSIGTARPFAFANTDERAESSNPKRLKAIKAAGIVDPENNFDLINSWIILTGDKVCVRLTAKEDGDFYVSGGKNSKCSSTCNPGANGGLDCTGYK